MKGSSDPAAKRKRERKLFEELEADHHYMLAELPPRERDSPATIWSRNERRRRARYR